MPTKRQVLETVHKNTLAPLLDLWSLQVDDRRVKGQIVDALVRSRKATLKEILNELPFKALKRADSNSQK